VLMTNWVENWFLSLTPIFVTHIQACDIEI